MQDARRGNAPRTIAINQSCRNEGQATESLADLGPADSEWSGGRRRGRRRGKTYGQTWSILPYPAVRNYLVDSHGEIARRDAESGETVVEYTGKILVGRLRSCSLSNLQSTVVVNGEEPVPLPVGNSAPIVGTRAQTWFKRSHLKASALDAIQTLVSINTTLAKISHLSHRYLICGASPPRRSWIACLLNFQEFRIFTVLRSSSPSSLDPFFAHCSQYREQRAHSCGTYDTKAARRSPKTSNDKPTLILDVIPRPISRTIPAKPLRRTERVLLSQLPHSSALDRWPGSPSLRSSSSNAPRRKKSRIDFPFKMSPLLSHAVVSSSAKPRTSRTA
ncbi:hypothetical protein FB451DRAFT_1178598 [Mycena latifolia]|nr:hypothetical protein FB451DRAFT_1178598 [Mycena latifolia]